MANIKANSDKQTKRINFRLNELEYEKLSQSASTYGLTVSSYAKQLALKSNLRKPYFSASDTQQIILELRTCLDTLTFDLILVKLDQKQEFLIHEKLCTPL
ncbi:plasmid mobilization relaxosome protein MobC (plasmid) [Lactiplantibacillus plantarum]|uniref:plasmid mobilization protein n=1 Tax=Lactiplantibacillus plantarum TaxID=1590 RepID=UPI000E7514C7|nr:plasmid mobilization relaxosome protein MobC [Lactiplantibacillus plantarum]AYE60537.1 plasmid mobilization relaxosome protein MobC [Lactiplantibacillus plantarum]QBJ57336.1 plasmid mobilization relaxosome protein MobC [Lactiplantibacillus plantarum]